MPAYSERYDAALALAARAHQAQKRKGSDVPYITHLAHVSVILIRAGFDEDVAIAGLLHDIVEDQNYPLTELEARFGPAVARMVAALTEQKQEGGRPRPWEARKQEALDVLGRTGLESVAVKAADTLHTVRGLASDLRERGPVIWQNFSRGPAPSLDYYQKVAEIVHRRMGNHPLAAELDAAVRDLKQAIDETGGREHD